MWQGLSVKCKTICPIVLAMNAGRTNVLLSKCGGSAFELGTAAGSSSSSSSTSSSSATTTITTTSGGTHVVSHFIGSPASGGYQLPIGLVSVNHSQQQQHLQQQQQHPHLVQHQQQHQHQIHQHQLDSRIINQMHRRQSQDKAGEQNF